MGVGDFQNFIETNVSSAVVNVDLLQIARGCYDPGYVVRGRGPRMCLAIDGESCLDRLYGGFYTDWVCGGQWNRMMDYLSNLASTCHDTGIQVVVFFDGSLEKNRLEEWFEGQVNTRKNVNFVLRHLHNKSTPPPKVWWIAPSSIRTALKYALRQLGIGVATSTSDHRHEVISFVREHNFHGLLAQDAVYAIFDPVRYFSAQCLKLTYKGTLETKEYIIDEVARQIDLNPDRFCVLAALLGNHILSDKDLKPFYKSIQKEKDQASEGGEENPQNKEIQSVIMFVRDQETVEDLDKLGEVVFGDAPDNADKVKKFKASVQYYYKGTAAGFVRVGSRTKYGGAQTQKVKPPPPVSSEESKEESSEANGEKIEIKASAEHLEHESGYASPPDAAAPAEAAEGEEEEGEKAVNGASSVAAEDGDVTPAPPAAEDAATADEEPASSSPSSSSPTPNSSLTPNSTPVKQQPKSGAGRGPRVPFSAPREPDIPSLPTVPAEVLRITTERHRKGMMVPWVMHVLTKGEIRLSATLEDDSERELPLAVDLYRPLRAYTYAVLFSIKPYRRKRGGEEPPPQPEVYIKEYSVVRPGPNTASPNLEVVKAHPLDWLTPSLKRLWLGQQIEDKNRRLRAFLSCLESDSPMMLNTSYVPQPLLLACCVLRYILQHRNRRVLRKHELDAFLAMMVSPHLHEPHFTQEIKLPLVSPRGVQLAALFMEGVEHAIYVNDVCGAPLPWTMCCQWLCFDGKLLHMKLLKSQNGATPLLDLCDGQLEQMMKVEGMKQAIMEGLSVDFAKLPLPMQLPSFSAPGFRGNYPNNRQQQPSFMNPGVPAGMQGNRGRGRGGMVGKSSMDSRGGQLEVAGVVVGQWGPNVKGGGRGRGGGGANPYYPGAPTSQHGVQHQYHGYSARGGSSGFKGGMRGRPGPSRGGPPSNHRGGGRSGPRPGPARTQRDMAYTSLGRGLSVEPADNPARSPGLPGPSSMPPPAAALPPHVTSVGTPTQHLTTISHINPQALEMAAAQLAASQHYASDQTVVSHYDPTAAQMTALMLGGGDTVQGQ